MTAGFASLALALVPASWLLPNHYPPWVSAWLDGFAFFSLALAALLLRRQAAVPKLWLAAALLALGSIVGQMLTGRLLFGGDAVMAAMYVGSLILAMAVGEALARPDGHSGEPQGNSPLSGDAASQWALGTVAATILCVAIALVQWTGIDFDRTWVVDLPPWGRPFSNLAQPNHFSTAAFLGLMSLALLREVGHVSASGFWIGSTFMLLGMVMSGSRTAWVQLLIAGALCAWLGRRARLRIRIGHVVAWVLLFVALQAAWSPLDELLGRNVDRPLEEKLAAGARPALWRELITAIPRAPLWGHGWQQIGAAQQAVALDRPPVPAFFEHFDAAHNVVLDLVLWAGVPIGGLIALLCALALGGQLRRLGGSGADAPRADTRAVWLIAGVLGLVAHGLLEFPLSFAYFLIPLGVSLGMIHALVPVPSAQRLPRWTVPAAGATLAVLLTVVGVEYFKAEENFRLARLETARIGTDRVGSDSPELRVLTQLDALLRFVRTEAKPDMAAEDLDRMRKVALRYGFSSTLFRYATALGLNGRPQEAARTLQLLCHIHSRKRCREAREAWPAMQQRYDVLRAVPPPEPPGSGPPARGGAVASRPHCPPPPT